MRTNYIILGFISALGLSTVITSAPAVAGPEAVELNRDNRYDMRNNAADQFGERTATTQGSYEERGKQIYDINLQERIDRARRAGDERGAMEIEKGEMRKAEAQAREQRREATRSERDRSRY